MSESCRKQIGLSEFELLETAQTENFGYLFLLTIRGVFDFLTSDKLQLITTLHHVDIHHFWLREKVQQGALVVDCVPAAKLKAEG